MLSKLNSCLLIIVVFNDWEQGILLQYFEVGFVYTLIINAYFLQYLVDTAMFRSHTSYVQGIRLSCNYLSRSSEGKTVEIPYRGDVRDTILNILGGLRSACTYVGAIKLKELPRRTTFIRVTQQLNSVFS